MAGYAFTYKSGVYRLTVRPDGQGNMVFTIYKGFADHLVVLPPDAVERLIAALSAVQAAQGMR